MKLLRLAVTLNTRQTIDKNSICIPNTSKSLLEEPLKKFGFNKGLKLLSFVLKISFRFFSDFYLHYFHSLIDKQ